MRNYAWTFLFACLVGCSYDGIEFPDDADGGCADGNGHGDDAGPQGGSGDDSGAPSDSDRQLSSGGPTELPPSERYQFEDFASPTPPEQLGEQCPGAAGEDELCGNGLDDDCDGTVDETVGLGQICPLPCAAGSGTFACDVTTGATVCADSTGVPCDFPRSLVGCGDGVHTSPGEVCDPAAAGERVGETCTIDCRRPMFRPCGTCDADTSLECDEWVGACLPLLGSQRKRCPDLVVEWNPADGPAPSPPRLYQTIEFESRCRVSCSRDSDCPSSLARCYASLCVPNY